MKQFEEEIKSFSSTKEYLTPQERKLATQHYKKKYTVGVPKEPFPDENRVCLTPQAVEMLTSNGHTVYIEKSAGNRAGFTDKEYIESGGILSTKEKVFSAQIFLQISPILPDQIKLLSKGQFVISTLQTHTRKVDYIKKMMNKKISALAIEYIKEKDTYYPFICSLSQIEGILAVHIAAEYLSKSQDGKGILFGGIIGVPPTEVVILGAGTAAEHAAKAAIGLGATVKIFDLSNYKLCQFSKHLGQKVYTSIFNPKDVIQSLQTADVMIGAFHYEDDRPLMVVTEDMIKQMKKGSVIIDLTIDKGGCFETSKSTTHQNPAFIQHGVIHYCVENISSLVPRTASIALSNIFAPLILKISNAGGISHLTTNDKGFRYGIYLFRGILTNARLGKKLGLDYHDINLLIDAL